MYELQDTKPPLEIPKAKTIVIDGVKRGTVEPSIVGDALRWHAVIELTTPLDGIGAGLAQGHGHTPDAAIVDSIIQARRCRDLFTSALAAAEKSLDLVSGTSELTVRRDAR